MSTVKNYDEYMHCTLWLKMARGEDYIKIPYECSNCDFLMACTKAILNPLYSIQKTVMAFLIERPLHNFSAKTVAMETNIRTDIIEDALLKLEKRGYITTTESFKLSGSSLVLVGKNVE